MSSHHFPSLIKSPHYLSASRLTFAALVLHLVNILVQVGVKFVLIKRVKQRKVEDPNYSFNRYQSDDPLLLAADRIVGNFLEWLPVFVGMVWLYAYHVGNPWIYGWPYLLARSLYPWLALRGGISRGGSKPVIFLSTVPQYIMLLALAFPVAYALFVPFDDFD